MSGNRVTVAAIQFDSQSDEEANWRQLEELCRRAAAHKASVLALPENVLYEGRPLKRIQDVEGTWKPRFSALAKELGVAIVCGSLRERTDDADSELSYNSCLAIDAEGQEVGRYRKIHLFDIDLEDGPTHKESDYLKPGKDIVSCDLPPLGRVGLSICYDLRFPELYRRLAREHKATTLFVPSSFTNHTGKDHWLPLLKARAIENQCYVIAPNQCGTKGSLQKYGRSVIIGPWGTVLACAPDGPGFALAELDFDRLAQLRRSLPCAEHARLLD